jgi:hypothetical protein
VVHRAGVPLPTVVPGVERVVAADAGVRVRRMK